MRHQDAVMTDMDKIRQKHSKKEDHKADIVELGIDLKEFYKSVEWDILGVPAQRWASSSTKEKMIKSATYYIQRCTAHSCYQECEVLHVL